MNTLPIFICSSKSKCSKINLLCLGEVKYAAVKMENGKSKGCGTVRFTTVDDARACSQYPSLHYV